MDRGITSYGVYIPSLRLERSAIAAAHAWAIPSLKGQAKGARAMANWDEDSVTMGVEAARGTNTSKVTALNFASLNPPFADLQNASLVAAGLGLPNTVSTADFAGSLRCGTTALAQAINSNTKGDTLVVAGDARQAKPGSVQEMQYGAGAVAMTIGSEGVIARLVAAAHRSDAFVDHFRATGEKFDYFWEERWVRDEGYGKLVPAAVKAVLAEAGVGADAIKHFVLPSTMNGVAAAVAKKSGVAAEAVVDGLAARCGDTGAAHAMMMLAAALERAQPGDKILVATFGAGVDVLLFEATEALAGYKARLTVADAVAGGRSDTHYTKLLSFQGELNLDWGMRGEHNEKIALTQQYRSREQLSHFMAGKCPCCGQVQFPQLASCINCGAFEPLEQVSLANETARIASYTADWLQFHPAPPLYFGLVQFDIGARVLMEIVDVDPAKPIDVGTPLRMVFRVKSKDNERHYHRYFWKAIPVAAQGE